MKSNILKITAMALLLAASAHSCKKEEPTLPPETQTGKNTFGCYVNGVLFLNDAPKGWDVKNIKYYDYLFVPFLYLCGKILKYVKDGLEKQSNRVRSQQ